VKIYSWIHRNNFQGDVKILITMHDELVFEVTTERLDFFVIELSKIMMLKEVISGQLKWEIPLTVDVQYGETWRVAENYFKNFPEKKKLLDEPIFESTPLSPNHSDTGIKKSSRYDIAREEAKESVIEEKEEKVAEKIPTVAEVVEEKNEKTKEPEEVNTSEEVSADEKYFVYTVRDTADATKRNLNYILDFIINETPHNKDSYEGPRRILKLKDRDNNSLMVSEYDVPVDCFRGLARLFRV